MASKTFIMCVPCLCYLTAGDTHDLCVVCLGVKHAQSALEGTVLTVNVCRCGRSASAWHCLRRVLSHVFLVLWSRCCHHPLYSVLSLWMWKHALRFQREVSGAKEYQASGGRLLWGEVAHTTPMGACFSVPSGSHSANPATSGAQGTGPRAQWFPASSCLSVCPDTFSTLIQLDFTHSGWSRAGSGDGTRGQVFFFCFFFVKEAT